MMTVRYHGTFSFYIDFILTMADPGGRGSGSARGDALHFAGSVRVPKRALSHHNPRQLAGAGSC